MQLKFARSRILPVGIDLGTYMVKLVQLRRLENDLDLVAAAAAELESPRPNAEPGRNEGPLSDKRQGLLVERVRDMLGSHPFKGRECVMALPASATYVQHVKIARVAPSEIERTLRWEMEGKLPFDASSAIIRHVVAGETYNEREAGLEVIVVAAARAAVEGCLELARRCKLSVVALEPECSAILGCFARLFRRVADQSSVNLFLDMGHSHTRVVIAHGARMTFARNLPLGMHHIMEGTGAAAAPLEGLTGEITKCLRYYESVFPTMQVERVIFLGGPAADRGLCGQIAQRLHLPAQIGDPLARIRIGVSGDGKSALNAPVAPDLPQPAWAVAVGLSLGGDAGREEPPSAPAGAHGAERIPQAAGRS